MGTNAYLVILMGCRKLSYYQSVKGEPKKKTPFLLGVVWRKPESPKTRVNYYPGGALQPGRYHPQDPVTSGGYRYGFNGMEKDDLIKGVGNSYATLFRQYDPRIGRWLSIDPEMRRFAGWSPYNFAFNNPIELTDPLGNQPPECPNCDKKTLDALPKGAGDVGPGTREQKTKVSEPASGVIPEIATDISKTSEDHTLSRAFVAMEAGIGIKGEEKGKEFQKVFGIRQEVKATVNATPGQGQPTVTLRTTTTVTTVKLINNKVVSASVKTSTEVSTFSLNLEGHLGKATISNLVETTTFASRTTDISLEGISGRLQKLVEAVQGHEEKRESFNFGLDLKGILEQ